MPSSPSGHSPAFHTSFVSTEKEWTRKPKLDCRVHNYCCVCLTEAQVRTRSRHVSSQVTLLLGLGQHHAWDARQEACQMQKCRESLSKLTILSTMLFNPTSVDILHCIHFSTHPVVSGEPETATDWREKEPISIGQLRELWSHRGRGIRRRSSGLIVCFSIVSQSVISITQKTRDVTLDAAAVDCERLDWPDCSAYSE